MIPSFTTTIAAMKYTGYRMTDKRPPWIRSGGRHAGLWLFPCRVTMFFTCMVIFLAGPSIVFAERVKPLNPDCKACPTVISYEGIEAKTILGIDSLRFLTKLKNREAYEKTIKIDLDGNKPVGSETDPDEGYELLVFSYKHLVAINSLQDTSVIKIETDFQNLHPAETSDKWMPEIQLMPSNRDALKKKDDLATAWKKMNASKLYQVINREGASHDKWNDNLTKFILQVLEAVDGK